MAEFEAAGEDEVRMRLYRGSGMHPEAKFHTAVRWLREQARTRKFREVRRRKGGTYPLSHLYRYFGLVRLTALGHDVPWVKA